MQFYMCFKEWENVVSYGTLQKKNITYFEYFPWKNMVHFLTRSIRNQ